VILLQLDLTKLKTLSNYFCKKKMKESESLSFNPLFPLLIGDDRIASSLAVLQCLLSSTPPYMLLEFIGAL